MQFKNPELLYALVLLIIPILIHLFQLRRFQKVQFTNVKFLKAVKLQTRRSSQLKKWLTLLTRLLLLACIILAFAQPFIPNTANFNEKQEIVIYLDNSFSMQAPGRNGTLLNEAIQDMLTSLPEDETISLFTNDKTFKNSTVRALKNELIQLSYSPNQLTYDAAYLKGRQLFSKSTNGAKNLILVSDFQRTVAPLDFEQDSLFNLKLVQLRSNLVRNVSIDSVYVDNGTAETLDLVVQLSNLNEPAENVSLSLFNNDALIAKSAVDIDDTAKTVFTVPANQAINGKLSIDDTGLYYDNTLYFNINEKPKIKVLAVNGTTNANFLDRIYTDDEFEFNAFTLDALNFNLIPDQNLIVLNELETIPNALRSALLNFKNDGGSLLIIPSQNITLESYNQLFKDLNVSPFKDITLKDKRVTSINYNHPLLQNAFYARVSNFQYPKVKESFQFSSSANRVLSYEDESAFLIGRQNIYIFSSALNETNSNFKNSQLIVPVFYNLGLQSLKLPKLYYTIGQSNSIAIPVVLGQDDILNLVSGETSVIPIQKSYSKSVVIQTDEFPDTAGILNVKNKNQSLQNLSFNYPRAESRLSYHELSILKDINVDNELSTSIDTIKSNSNINALWKWFVIFALVFLIVEMLLLKYLK